MEEQDSQDLAMHKSIIFMDVATTPAGSEPQHFHQQPIHINMANRENEITQDRSFSESISTQQNHENHYKREEFYTKKLYHDILVDRNAEQVNDQATKNDDPEAQDKSIDQNNANTTAANNQENQSSTFGNFEFI